MNPSRYRKIKDTFAEVRELAESQRSAYLDVACEGDAELRVEVEELLVSDQEADAGPLAAALSQEGPRPKFPEHIGNYQLRELIGAEGRAITALRPVGVVKIGGERVDALSELGVIESGTDIVVTDVYDNQVKVRAVSKTP